MSHIVTCTGNQNKPANMNLSIYELLPSRQIRQYTRFDSHNQDIGHYKNYLFVERKFREISLNL